MTSRRAAPLASRFSSRQSPPAPRLRWAAALAIAYLAVAGCAAQADNANQAAAQAVGQSAI
ncbi:alpha,alpha-trehalase, partial [Pseudomonas aeruginosa]|nr:alpha,alpha-trehalase [Pseudomonas aeruginosa]